ncbi:MAG: DUF2797 domain-containing protein [Actinomycetota bacterium]
MTGLPSSGPGVILGMTWVPDDTDPSRGDQCLLRVRGTDSPSDLVPAVGLSLNYRIGERPTRHCIGTSAPTRTGGGSIDCQNPPQPGERVCVSCAVAEATLAGSLHHAHTKDRAELDRAVVDHLSQTNVLYLAGFRDGSVKVGTSTGRRKRVRWLEQGAWRVVEVATVDDGFAVRRLEDLVTEKLGLAQSVAVKRKLAGLAAPLDDAALAAKLDHLVGEVHALLALASDAEATVTSREPWTFPGAGAPIWDRLLRYPSRLDAGAHDVRIEAMCGRVAVLARPGDDGSRFVSDIGALYGIELDLGDHRPDPLAVQDTLF